MKLSCNVSAVIKRYGMQKVVISLHLNDIYMTCTGLCKCSELI